MATDETFRRRVSELRDSLRYSDKGRRLLMLDKVMRLSLSKQQLFVKGSAPPVVAKINYLTDPGFRGIGAKPLFDLN